MSCSNHVVKSKQSQRKFLYVSEKSKTQNRLKEKYFQLTITMVRKPYIVKITILIIKITKFCKRGLPKYGCHGNIKFKMPVYQIVS